LWDFLVKNTLDRLFQQSHQKPWDFFEFSKTFYFHHHRIRLLLSQFIITAPEFFLLLLFFVQLFNNLTKSLETFSNSPRQTFIITIPGKKNLLLYLSNMLFCNFVLTNSTSFLQTFDSLQLLYNSFSLQGKFCFFNFFFFYSKQFFFFTFICLCFPSFVVITFPFYWWLAIYT
jgi:hypothetical protein